MRILALDTSTTHLTIAVLDGETLLASFHEKVDREHSRLVVPMIDKTIKKAGLRFGDIDGIAIGVGPGSFTGLRIGITTVKGLAYSTGKPVAAVPTFDAVAQNAAGFEGVVCVVLDARKNNVYGRFYRSTAKGIKPLTRHLLVPASELMKIAGKYDKIMYIGDGVSIIGKPENTAFDWHPRAEAIARLAIGIFREKKTVTPDKLEPMYLYSKECGIIAK